MVVNNIQFTKIEIQIAKYVFKHYKERYNSRLLARMLGINHAHANKLCNMLVGKKLFVKEEIGNSAYFSFDYGNEMALKFMQYMLSLEEKDFPKWLVVLLHNLKKFEPYIDLGIVFGSSVKREDYQDIDVLLVYNKEKAKDVNRIKEEIRRSQQVEKPIRYVDITPKDIIKNKDDKVFYSMISDSLVFHNPEKYVEVIKKCHS